MRTSSILKWVLLIGLILGLGDTAEAARKRKRRLKRKPKVHLNVDHKLDWDWLNGAFVREPAESVYNPGNGVFETETFGARTDLNVDYRATINNRHKLVARPRAYTQYLDIKLENPERKLRRNRGRIDVTELFTESWLSARFSLTVGLQNFQWGPAELLSPTNPLVHFNREQRSLLWREKGRAQARLNWAPSLKWSHVLLLEPVNNGEDVFTAGRDFSPKAMFKSEYRSRKEAQNYVGVAGGSEEETSPFAGLYFNYAAAEGLSLYSDFRFTHDPFVYTPQANVPGVYEMRKDDHLSALHLGVYGLRYEGETFDLRVEAIYNSAGYSKADFKNALESASPFNPFSTANFRRAMRPGLELPGKAYGYVSLRLPDLGDEDLWQLSLRYLHSGMDGTGSAGWSVERGLGDNFVLTGEGRYNIGKQDGEFTIQERLYTFLGIRILW